MKLPRTTNEIAKDCQGLMRLNMWLPRPYKGCWLYWMSVICPKCQSVRQWPTERTHAAAAAAVRLSEARRATRIPEYPGPQKMRLIINLSRCAGVHSLTYVAAHVLT